MNAPISAFRAECIKWRKSWALLTALLGPICQVGFLFVIIWYSEERVRQFLPGFRFWLEINHVTWNVMFLPILAALVSDLSWGLEDDSGTWAHLLIQPIPRWVHYWIKLVSHLCLLGITQALLALLLVPAGLLLQKNPNLSMGPVQWALLLRLTVYSWLASVAVIVFHTWVSSRVRGLWVGLTIGILGTWICVQMLEQPGIAQLFPWGMASQIAGLLQRLRPWPAWSLAGGSLGSALLFIVIGTMDFLWRKQRT